MGWRGGRWHAAVPWLAWWCSGLGLLPQMLGDIDHLRLLMIGDDPRPGEQRPVMIEVGRVTPGRMRVRTPQSRLAACACAHPARLTPLWTSRVRIRRCG